MLEPVQVLGDAAETFGFIPQSLTSRLPAPVAFRVLRVRSRGRMTILTFGERGVMCRAIQPDTNLCEVLPRSCKYKNINIAAKSAATKLW